ncbi:phospholipid scramblase-related protein [Actinomadura sediminis]|uniref:Phospholipid scramblase-related protein n=1 Tax=Actinomadura sediminis TaxID=1038904 RepID=A0ABW3EU75_9ACTN
MYQLFNSPVLTVDQPRRAPSARSEYKVFDGRGTLVARAAEGDVSALKKAFRIVIGDGGAGRVVHVESPDGHPLLTVQGGPNWAMVHLPDGTVVGSIREAPSRRHAFDILDAAQRPIGGMDAGPWRRKFRIVDANGTHVAQMDKKWKGFATEMALSADKYRLDIHQAIADPLRTLVVMSPLAIDLILYEGKDWIPG